MSRKPDGYWTEDRVRKEAIKYATKQEFRIGAGGAFTKATVLGILNDICAHMKDGRSAVGIARTKWTPNAIKIEAKKYSSYAEFKKLAGSAYNAASSELRKELKAEFPKYIPKSKYNKENIISIAKKYKNISALEKFAHGAYAAAKRLGILEDLRAMYGKQKGSIKADSIYMWEATGETYNGKQVYKIGITSSHLKNFRVRDTAKKHKMKSKILCLRYVGVYYALKLEQYLLQFGENPKISRANGHTEFRALTDEEVKTIVRIIEAHPFHI